MNVEGPGVMRRGRRKTVVVLKGYPRLSETFIAQELLGLEQAGLDLVIASLRRPTDKKRHPVHDEIKAPVFYLPEYLHEEPLRVLRALLSCLPRPGFWRALRAFLADLPRDVSRNRVPPARARHGARRRMARGRAAGCMRISSTRRPRPRATRA